MLIQTEYKLIYNKNRQSIYKLSQKIKQLKTEYMSYHD
jgi:hypothetical protein